MLLVLVLALLVVLLLLFEDARFSSEDSAVLAAVVSPDFKAVLSVLNNDFMLDAVLVESVVEVLLALDELSDEY